MTMLGAFVKERNEALFSLDRKKIEAYMIKYGETEIAQTPDVVFWASVYKAICGVKDAPEVIVSKAKAWLHEHGITADAIVGAKTKDLLILEDKMKEVCNLYVTTDDGSYVRKGMGTDVLRDLVQNQGKEYDLCVAIGPMIMMKFVCLLTKELNIPTVVSMNPIMVDGTGMCGACRLMVGGEVKFACVDGPEFDGHKVDFDLAMKRQQMYKTEEGRALLKLQEGDTHHGGCGHCGGDK